MAAHAKAIFGNEDADQAGARPLSDSELASPSKIQAKRPGFHGFEEVQPRDDLPALT
jgi:hypothetical protein